MVLPLVPTGEWRNGMFEPLYIFAYRFTREPPARQRSTAEMSDVSGWVGIQGFLAGLVFSVVGLAAVAFLSSDEKRGRRIAWAIAGGLTGLGLVLLAT
jgi:hypothetical protein